MISETFGAETVTIACLLASVVFEVVNVSFPFPITLVFTFNQLSLETAVHVVFEDTLIKPVLFAIISIIAVFPETDNVASPTACVTVMVLFKAPGAVIVTVATRVVINGLADEVTKLIVPSPVLPEVVVNQL